MNNIQRTLTRGLDLSLSFAQAGGIGGLLALTTHGASTNSYWYYFDGNGNVVDLIDAGDTTVAHYEYEPFGRKMVSTGTLATQPYQSSSKEHDARFGLSYFGFRFYSANLGRWGNRDPDPRAGGAESLPFCFE